MGNKNCQRQSGYKEIKINIITVSKHTPNWVEIAFKEYAKRLNVFQLNLIEIPLSRRTKNGDIKKNIQEEGEKIIAKIPKDTLVIALDEHGEQWSSTELAAQFKTWQIIWKNITIIIGGPDGLSEACLKKASLKWSLSKLTFPHQLVRVILIEQLHRAWSILNNHPYHRTTMNNE